MSKARKTQVEEPALSAGPDKTPADLVELVAGPLHAGDRIEAANAFLSATGARLVRTEQDALITLNVVLRWCLDNDRKELSAKLLWTPSQFTADPRSVRMIWDAVDKHRFVMLMGASSMGKTYTPGVQFYLEWLRDPQFTQVRAVGPSEEHLQTNLFTHLVMLHEGASIPLPGVVQDLFIGLNPRSRKGAILGTVIPQGRKAAGRLQGSKRSPRPHPHPIFGKMSRLFILVDEIENVPQGLTSDMQNLIANIVDKDDRGFKLVACFNPKDITKSPYVLCEPKLGWRAFDIEKDEEWDSRRGYHVVRLDAEKSENVVADQVLFPGLQTKAGITELSRQSGGTESAGYYTFGRGAYPKLGSDETLFRQGMLDERLAFPLWVKKPDSAGGADLALQGGDAIQFSHGTYGTASGVRYSDGRVVPFRNSLGEVVERPVVWLDQILSLPKGDTIPVATSVRDTALAKRIAPGLLALDRTGVGSGVHDVIGTIWSSSVVGVNNSESPTERKIIEEDKETPKERFPRKDSELVFALRELVEHGFFWFNPDLTTKAVLWQQLTSRKYYPGNRNRIETKPDYKARGNPSPDEFDSVTLMLHAVRQNAGLIFSIEKHSTVGRSSELSGRQDDRDIGPVIDVTNQFEDLDSPYYDF
jgi:hypothetical protein